nr:hypothetical protein Iba_chr14eCG4630 [Ipomoea batatas]
MGVVLLFLLVTVLATRNIVVPGLQSLRHDGRKSGIGRYRTNLKQAAAARLVTCIAMVSEGQRHAPCLEVDSSYVLRFADDILWIRVNSSRSVLSYPLAENPVLASKQLSLYENFQNSEQYCTSLQRDVANEIITEELRQVRVHVGNLKIHYIRVNLTAKTSSPGTGGRWNVPERYSASPKAEGLLRSCINAFCMLGTVACRRLALGVLGNSYSISAQIGGFGRARVASPPVHCERHSPGAQGARSGGNIDRL